MMNNWQRFKNDSSKTDREIIIKKYVSTAQQMARRIYKKRHYDNIIIDEDDINSIAYIGLIKSVDGFNIKSLNDKNIDKKFKDHLYVVIKNSLIDEQRKIDPCSVNMNYLKIYVYNILNSYFLKHGFYPDENFVYKYIKIHHSDVKLANPERILNIIDDFKDSRMIKDFEASIENINIKRSENIEHVKFLLNDLNIKEKDVLLQSFGLKEKNSSMNKSTFNSIKSRAIKKLQNRVNKDESIS